MGYEAVRAVSKSLTQQQICYFSIYAQRQAVINDASAW
ncbi:hypothetical protein YpMG051020_1644, partial [Yersinia pestis biovar Orientalis str. MG05-1020]